MTKSKCKSCNRNFNTLTDEKLCYYCHYEKHKSHPTTGVYKVGKLK